MNIQNDAFFEFGNIQFVAFFCFANTFLPFFATRKLRVNDILMLKNGQSEKYLINMLFFSLMKGIFYLS